MLVLLSPAKKLNFEAESVSQAAMTTPALLKETRRLMETTSRLSAAELSKMMKLSDSLAQLNYQRFQDFDVKATRPKTGRQAAFAFDGDTYTGLHARDMSEEDMVFAQSHVRILSGLYGLLRPLDGIQPYRLEMGTRVATERGKNLYEFWGSLIARQLDKELGVLGADTLINCASNEYFGAARVPSLKARVITPVFKEIRGGIPKIISFSAKRARGTMARFIVDERLTDPAALKKFDLDGYSYVPKESSDSEWHFYREQG